MAHDHDATCDVCRRGFPFSRGRYDGRYLTGYRIVVCDTCYCANHDGWALHNEPKVMAKRRELGLPAPARLQNGLLPPDF